MGLRGRLAAFDDVVIVAGGMPWDLHHEVARWYTLLWDRVNCVRTIILDGYAVFRFTNLNLVDGLGNPKGQSVDILLEQRDA